jgi:hypothetical protein
VFGLVSVGTSRSPGPLTNLLHLRYQFALPIFVGQRGSNAVQRPLNANRVIIPNDTTLELWRPEI